METDAATWIANLPTALARHAAVLQRLLDEAHRDERSASWASGAASAAGSRMSTPTIDAYMAVAPEHWERYLSEVSAMAARLGSVSDMSQKRVAPSGRNPYEIAWVLYDDGIQLELVVAQAASELHPGSGLVVLYDRDGRVKERRPERYATIQDVRDHGAPGLPGELLDLHRSDQAFAHRVVERVSDRAHAPDEALGGESAGEGEGGVLPEFKGPSQRCRLTSRS